MSYQFGALALPNEVGNAKIIIAFSLLFYFLTAAAILVMCTFTNTTSKTNYIGLCAQPLTLCIMLIPLTSLEYGAVLIVYYATGILLGRLIR